MLTPVCFFREFQNPMEISSSCNLTRARVVVCALVGAGRFLRYWFPESLFRIEIIEFSEATQAYGTSAKIGCIPIIESDLSRQQTLELPRHAQSGLE